MSFEERAKSLGLASKDEWTQVLNQGKDAILLDVRTEEEIAASGKFETQHNKWVHVPCTADSAEQLTGSSEFLLPDKEAPVVIYCRSGRRASTAKRALEEQGYKTVLNAGGLTDMI